MPVENPSEPIDVESVLAAYLTARIDSASIELDKARAVYRLEVNTYTHGKLLWAEHQHAALTAALRDVPHWKNVLERYAARLRKRRYKT